MILLLIFEKKYRNMKNLILLLVMAFSTISFAQQNKKKGPPPGKTLVGENYGADVSADTKAVSTNRLHKELEKMKKLENVAVKGKVKEVCKAEGCWLTLETDNGERFFVKNKDHAFLIPLALEGKNVIVTGSAENKVTSVKELKHFAEDAKKSQEEIDAITKDKKEVRFLSEGIKVVK